MGRVVFCTVICMFALLLGGCAGSRTSHDLEPPAAVAARATARMAGIDVAYTDSRPGAGDDAVILVHGWACDGRIWREQAAALARRHRVLNVDLPGHGGSGKPDLAYSMDFQADAIAAVMDDAGVGRAVLVGHSNGTPVVRQFQRRHPARALALVAVDGTLVGMVAPAMLEAAIARLEAADYRTTLMAFAGPMLPAGLSDAQRDELVAMIDGVPQHVLIATLRSANDPAIWVKDPIEAPLLMVLAEAPMWTPGYRREVRGLCPAADIHTFRGVSHALFLDDPEAFTALLEGFIDAHRLF